VQIEALLNSRPLTPMSADPNDLTPITPAHFLIGRIFTSVADPTLIRLSDSRLSKWQLVQKLQHFWQRWSKEYLSELQCRTKWKVKSPQVNQGALVLIKDDYTPPMKWRLGRLIQLHPGKDSIPRVVSIQTSKRSGPQISHKNLPITD